MRDEIFQSAVRSDGGVAGVFEFDGDVGYFYLYDLSKGKGNQISSSMRIVSGDLDFSEPDVRVSWNKFGNIVGLYIRDQLWAAFNIRGVKYGGVYSPGGVPMITADLLSSF